MSVTVGGSGRFIVTDTGTVTSRLSVPSLYRTVKLPVRVLELFTVGRTNDMVTVPPDSVPDTLTMLRTESGVTLTNE